MCSFVSFSCTCNSISWYQATLIIRTIITIFYLGPLHVLPFTFHSLQFLTIIRCRSTRHRVLSLSPNSAYSLSTFSIITSCLLLLAKCRSLSSPTCPWFSPSFEWISVNCTVWQHFLCLFFYCLWSNLERWTQFWDLFFDCTCISMPTWTNVK